jgi:hypothetical protein
MRPATPGLVAKSAGPDLFDASPMTLYSPAHVVAPSNRDSGTGAAASRDWCGTRSVDPPESRAARAAVPFSRQGHRRRRGCDRAARLGRTVTVRGTGPLDDDYAVDAIEDGYLMVRYVPFGTSQMLELVSRQRIEVPSGSPDDTPPD